MDGGGGSSLPSSISSPLSSVLTVLGESGAEVLFLAVTVWSSDSHSSPSLFDSTISTFTTVGISSLIIGRASFESDWKSFLGESGATFLN